MATVIDLPFPANLLQVTWFLVGFMFGRAFKTTDHDVQESDWFKNLSPFKQKVVANSLNFLHHFWIGLLLMTYANYLIGEVYWFGYGLFVDDLPDVPSRFVEWFHYIRRK